MGANVKPLTHWAIYKGYRLRVTQRETGRVAGLLRTADGERAFRYDAATMTVYLDSGAPEGETVIRINEYGWEIGGEDGVA